MKKDNQSIENLSLRCLVVDDEAIAVQGLVAYIDKVEFLEVAATCSSATEAAGLLRKTSIDLLFLDINMPHLNGMEFLDGLENPPLTIITTAYAEYALDGFRLNVVDYLMKPIPFKRFFKAVSKAGDLFYLKHQPSNDASKQNPYMYAKEGDTYIRINPGDILYVEGMQNYMKLHFKDKTIIVHQTMQALEKTLLQPDFYRIHRSYLVNLTQVRSISSGRLTINNMVLPIAKNRRKNLLEKVVYKNLLSELSS